SRRADRVHAARRREVLRELAARRAGDRALAAREVSKPRVSVVVPTYRRPKLLARCLAALAAQTLPAAELEVIVVHDGPNGAARSLAERWLARWRRDGGPRLEFLAPPHGGPAAARNAGWRAAAADIVAFTDD